MSRPTAAQLIDRLKELHEARTGEQLTDEKLAGQLPITMSTLSRWKKADTKTFRGIVMMLDQAGVLAWEPSSGSGGAAGAAESRLSADLKAVRDALAALEQLERHLRGLLDPLRDGEASA